MKARINANLKTLICIGIIFLMELIFFRELLEPGAMIGDRGDARLNNLIMEHWYNVFLGQEKVLDLRIFYPASGDIGYTDMLFATSIPYSVFRLFGCDIFLAEKLVLVLLHIFGSITLYILLHTILKYREYASLMGVASFSFASGYANRIGHTQMLAVGYIPLILIFLILYIRNFETAKIRRTYGILFVSSYALLAYTGWYCFFFFTLYAGIAALVIGVHLYKNEKKHLLDFAKKIKTCILEIALMIVYLFCLLIPFVWIYLSAAKTMGARPWSEVVYYMPQLMDLVNVGERNLQCGGILEFLDFSQYRSKGKWELEEGFSYVLLVLIGYFSLKMLKDYRKKRKAQIQLPIKKIIQTAMTRCMLFSFLLPVEIGGYSIWWLIYRFVPGGTAIRAVSRWWFFMLLPIGIWLAGMMDQYDIGIKKYGKKRWFYGLLLAWLYFSNMTTGFSSWNYKTSDKELLAETPAPPKDAKVMMIEASVITEKYVYYQLDAWLIADYYDLQTINGYSGGTLKEWDLADTMQTGEYMQAAADWIDQNDIAEDVYVYNITEHSWRRFIRHSEGRVTQINPQSRT